MKLSRLHHVAVICSDYPRSLKFYTKTLGLRLIAENNAVCPHCGNADGNVGLLTPIGQKLYKDLHE